MRKQLDARGFCCGAPAERYGHTHAFCYRCLATFDQRSGLQIESLFYVERAGHLERRPAME